MSKANQTSDGKNSYQSLEDLLGQVNLDNMSPLPKTDYSSISEKTAVYNNNSVPSVEKNLRNPIFDDMAADFLCD